MVPFSLYLSVQAQQAFFLQPDIHGDKVVFVCEGDLWVGSVSQKSAYRLTSDAGTEAQPRFSPDGLRVLYSAEYEGVSEVYTIPVSGGTPTRLTYRYDYADPMGWSADGKTVLYRARSFPRSFGLYSTPATGGPETTLPIEFAAHGVFTSTGNLVFTRFNRADDAWFRYKGGMQNQIWTGDLSAKKFRQITDLPGTCEYPVELDGTVYFAHEDDGRFDLVAVPQSGGRAKSVTPLSPFEILEVNAGPGGVVYSRGASIERYDPKSGKTETLEFELNSDLIHTQPYSVPAQEYVTGAALTATGQRVLVSTRGQIANLPVGEGEARLWKSVPGVRLEAPQPSPDGKSVAYVSDASGEPNIWLSDSDGGNERQLTKGSKRQIKSLDWSPDAKWIVYYDSDMTLQKVEVSSGKVSEIVHSNAKSWSSMPYSFSPDSKVLAYTAFDPVTDMGRIAVHDLATGETKLVGNGFTHDNTPSFSKDGKYLAFSSRRSFPVRPDQIFNSFVTSDSTNLCVYLLQKDVKNPLATPDPQEPVKKDAGDKKEEEKPAGPKGIEWEGLNDRLVVLPIAPGSPRQVDFVTESKFLYADGGEIRFYDVAKKAGGTLTPGGGYSLSADGKKALVGTRVVDTGGAGIPAGSGALSFGNLRLTVDPKQEWRQIFWDSWRLLRDYFYVANMHGLDWDAIGKKYAAFLPAVRSRDELDILIRWLQAELGSSHQYLSPGDEQTIKPTLAGAYLGISVVPDPVAKRLKIATIMRGDGVNPSERSPLIQAGFDVKEGDYLLAVAGQTLTDGSNYLRYLAGRAGQNVSVTVASKPDGSDKRTTLVKPFSLGSLRRIGIVDWVQRNRDYVTKATDGRIGYLYVQAMSDMDVADIVRQYYPQRHKEALIVDTRFNNGGYTQTVILKIIGEKISGYFNMRGSEYPWTRQSDGFEGPMACLINEFNVSCGEEFPHHWRDRGLGKLIGRRTYGGEVGSSPGWRLMDGGVLSVPNYGMFTRKDGWVIEGPGVSPDIDVESDPNAFAQGKDPQLDKAIEQLFSDLKKKPTTWPKQPADPVKAKNGGIG